MMESRELGGRQLLSERVSKIRITGDKFEGNAESKNQSLASSTNRRRQQNCRRCPTYGPS